MFRGYGLFFSSQTLNRFLWLSGEQKIKHLQYFLGTLFNKLSMGNSYVSVCRNLFVCMSKVIHQKDNLTAFCVINQRYLFQVCMMLMATGS